MQARNQVRAGGVWFWIAGIIVAVAVVFGVVGLLSAPTAQTNADTGTGAEEPVPVAPPAAGACSRSSDSRDVPTDLRWEARDGLTWPVSDTTGPTRTQQGFDVCFEHSPIGAALAAIGFMYSRTDHTTVDTYDFWVIDSPGKEAGRQTAIESDAHGTFVEQRSQFPLTPAGFRVEEYSMPRAVVRLVFNTSSGMVGMPLRLEWSDGDWRAKVDDFGGVLNGGPFSGEFTRWQPRG